MKDAITYRLDTPPFTRAAHTAGWTADPEYGWKRRCKPHDKAEAHFFSGPNKHHGFVCQDDGHVYVRFANLALAYDDANKAKRKAA